MFCFSGPLIYPSPRTVSFAGVEILVMPICVSDGAIYSDTICFGEFSPVGKCASIGKPGFS